MEQHLTVLRDEAVAALVANPEGVFVDGTFGRGGHSQQILQSLAPSARLLGIDKDPQAELTGRQLAAQDSRFSIARGSFADYRELLKNSGFESRLDGALLDLGVSSPQLDQAERGFSFLRDGDLDMRMDTDRGISAAQWLAEAEEGDIASVLKEYGEERFAKRIARGIVQARELEPIRRTGQLAHIISEANPAWEKHKHPATRSFQAIRVFINNELGDLQRFLSQIVEDLQPGGRLVVISFHSLEDRIVKRFMRDESRGQVVPAYIPVTAADDTRRMKLVGKAVRASEQEVQQNPRARSAVMRVAEKLG